MMRDGVATFLQACLLLLIAERPDHGYDLVERLAPFGLADGDAATTYRSLRALERSGLVESRWAPSDSGPARRVYRVTETGAASLHTVAERLRGHQTQLDLFLRRHDRIAGTRPRDAAAPSPRAKEPSR